VAGLGRVGGVAMGPVVRFGQGVEARARARLRDPARRAFFGVLDVGLAGVDAGLRSEMAQEVFDRVLQSAFADDFLDRVIARVADSPDVERLVLSLVDSRVLDAALVQLLESEGLWVLIEEIVQSPTVTSAISQQGFGFANQVAGVVRDRSRTADDRLEGLARRLTRRAARVTAPAVEPGAVEAPAVDAGLPVSGP
jgi:hypothetical protein